MADRAESTSTIVKRARIGDLLRIIDLCRVVERKGADPFDVDVKRSLEALKTYLPKWRLLDELLLDAEALNQLSSIVKLQSDWVRYRASSFYFDPLLVELKVRLCPLERLAEVFQECWHPIVEVQQISSSRLKRAMDYWNLLPPLKDRLKGLLASDEVEPASLSLKDLLALKIISEEDFEGLIQRLWRELQSIPNSGAGVEYWSFISKESFEDTVLRAYLVSFLVSQGYASLHVDPIEEVILLIPYRFQRKPPKASPPRSIAIPLDPEAWVKALEAKKIG